MQDTVCVTQTHRAITMQITGVNSRNLRRDVRPHAHHAPAQLVGDFEGMNISSTPSGEQTPTTSIASNNSTLIPDKVNQSEEQELLKKIMDSEYLGMEVKEWINASKNPKDLFSFVMKMLDLVF
jgi:hypothetical protein